MTIHTVGILVYDSDRILLVKHTEESPHVTGDYGLPSGRPLDDESETEACVRKLYRETGLVTQETNLIRVPTVYFADVTGKSGTLRFSLRPYVCTSWSGGPAANEREVVPEWINLNDLERYSLLPNVRAIISDCCEFRRGHA